MPVDDIQARTFLLEEKFEYLKKSTLQNCELEHVSVQRLAALLKTLPVYKSVSEEKFLNEVCEDLDLYSYHSEVFAALKYHWKYYFWHQMLGVVIERLDLKVAQEELNAFKSDLHSFFNQVRLLDFVKSEEKKRIRPPQYSELIADFDWPDDALLNMIEEFQCQYLDFYDLHQYVMVLATAEYYDRFTITWFIPDMLIKVLKASLPYELFKQFSVYSLTIAGDSVYIIDERKSKVKPAFAHCCCGLYHYFYCQLIGC